MNRTFLRGLGLEQETIDSIMAEYGTDIEGLKDRIDTLTKERDTATETLKKFDGVDVEKLKNESETLKNEYEGKIRDMQVRGQLKKLLPVQRLNILIY